MQGLTLACYLKQESVDAMVLGQTTEPCPGSNSDWQLNTIEIPMEGPFFRSAEDSSQNYP